jgi:hypothetical protein
MSLSRLWESNNFVAMLGGMMPTLCAVGSHFAVQPDAPLPQLSLLVPLAIFAFIGLAASHGLSPADRKQAFALGISAPAIIASIASGTSKPQVSWFVEFAPAAYAQQSGPFAGNVAPGNPSVLFAGKPKVTNDSRVFVLGYSPGNAGQTSSMIDVSGTTSNGQTLPIGSFWANSAHSNIIVGPSDLNSITLKSSNGVVTNVPLQPDTKQIDVTPTLNSSFEGDMLWGLGANRKLSVSGFQVKKADKVTIAKDWDPQYKGLVGE